MATSSERPGAPSEPPSDPMAAARRYAAPPRRKLAPANSRGEQETESAQGSGVVPTSAASPRTPMIFGVVGIVCWFLCGVGAVASVVLGIVGQRKARELGQSDLVPKIAWIGGIVVLVLDVIGFIVLPPTYSG